MGRATWFLLAVLLLAGCGGGGSNESEQGGPVIQTIQISEKEFSLNPSTVSLSKPGTYEFAVTNDGQITHSLEIEGHDVEEEAEDIDAGSKATLKVTLSDNGSYEMYCPIDGHRQSGMQGTITVGGTAGGAGTTTDEMETETGETTTGQTTTGNSTTTSSGPGY
jgi:plastocyanin